MLPAIIFAAKGINSTDIISKICKGTNNWLHGLVVSLGTKKWLGKDTVESVDVKYGSLRQRNIENY